MVVLPYKKINLLNDGKYNLSMLILLNKYVKLNSKEMREKIGIKSTTATTSSEVLLLQLGLIEREEQIVHENKYHLTPKGKEVAEVVTKILEILQ